MLNSCSWRKCKAEGLIFVNEANKLCQSISLDNFEEIIYSYKIKKALISKLNENNKYTTHLVDNDIFENLDAEEITDASIIKFIYKHSDSNFANAVVNNWMNVIIKNHVRKCYKYVPSHNTYNIEVIEYARSTCSVFGFFDFQTIKLRTK